MRSDGDTFLEGLLRAHRPGHALAGAFYGDPAVHALDMRAIFHRHWLFAAASCELPEPGSYVTLDVGATPILLVRDRDGEIRGFFNSCRHRGFKLCDAARGRRPTLVCPYHNWAYRLDGRLSHAPAMGEDFDRAAYGLKPVHVRVLGGTVYVCLADTPPDFAPYAQAMAPQLAVHDLEHAKVAAESHMVARGNWKLVMENSRECYHCKGQHKELMQSFLAIYDFANPDQLAEVQAYWAKWREAGIADGTAEGPDFRASRLPLTNDARSITLDGSLAVTRPLGRGPADAFGSLRWVHYPTTFNHALTDYAVLFRMLPLGPEETLLTTKWLVDRDAMEGRDYEVADLMAAWEVTNEQDKLLIERNQAGVRSLGYEGGPYSPSLEAGVIKFVQWYIDEVSAFLEGGPGDGGSAVRR